MIVVGLMIAGGRLWFARTAVLEAAENSARAATLARNAQQARIDGTAAAAASLATNGLTCTDRSVAIDTSAFAVAPGAPATITSVVTCHVPFGDILLPGMSGSVTVAAASGSALDTYRARS